jgi:gluconokinase
MKVLSFDIASGGISAAVFDSQLETDNVIENSWKLESGERGAAVLSASSIVEAFKGSIQALSVAAKEVQAICIGSFLHNFVLLDEAGLPLTPVFTWLDRRGETGLDFVRSRLAGGFHEITGCRYHPMFPVFKLASMRLNEPDLIARAKRVVSIKAFLINRLAGVWIEDDGMASASGLFNIRQGDWDSGVLSILGLERGCLPAITSRTAIAGNVTETAAAEFGLPVGIPVVAGSGDGFLANVGSNCEVPSRIAVTLGTSAVVRQTLKEPVFDSEAGTFCYRAGESAYIVGCAGSNGGNVIEWGRRILGTHDASACTDPPIFIPLLNGERSPDWDPHLTGSWHRLTARHTAADLTRSVVEGVMFNLAHFVEVVQEATGAKATDLVLSGNGFLEPMTASTLAALVTAQTWIPREPGLASLRGAGICIFRALGLPVPALGLQLVKPIPDAAPILRRYSEYRRLRLAEA